MAETSDSSPPPLEMRKTKPGSKRLILTLTVFFSFLSALPWLLKSIEIYRSPLPFQDISNAVDSNPLVFPCQFHLLFVNNNKHHATSFHPDENLGFLIASYMSEYAGNTSCGTCDKNYSVSVASDATEVSALTEFNFDQADELVDDYLLSVVGRGRVYTIVVVNSGDRDGVRAVVGKYRHGWVIGRAAEAEMLAEMFVKVFASGAKEEPSIQGEFMPVGADGRIVLSFNLLNADPRDGIYDWYEIHSIMISLIQILTDRVFLKHAKV